MIYYVDGYNLLFSHEDIIDDFTVSREDILDQLYKKIKPLKLSLIIVFDAYQRLGEVSRVDYKEIEVVYTAHKQKADDYIIDVFRRSKKAKQMVVVTNDRALSEEVKSLNGKALKLQDFFSLLKEKKTEDEEKEASNAFNEHTLDYYTRIFIDRFNSESS